MSDFLKRDILSQLSSTKSEPTVHWRSFGKRQWDQALNWLDLSGLALYFLHSVRSSGGLETLPDDVRAVLEQRSNDNRCRTEKIVDELGILIESLTQARVKYAVLKGIALLPDYCPDPALRTQYDHDILVDAASLSAAEDVLQHLGYRRKKTKDGGSVVVYRQPDAEIRFSKTSEGLYSPRLGRSVELHLTLWEEAEEQIRLDLRDDFLERRQLRHWNGMDYMALCDEDCLLFQILHAFRHILRNWCRLSIFLEIGCFLKRRSPDREFWDRFARRIEDIRWAPEASLVIFGLAEHLFGAEPLSQLVPSLQTSLSPALILWNERYGQRSALSNFLGDKSSLFLHREFVDDPSAWSSILRRRLLPIRRPHRPPALVFQRSFSPAGKMWMESAHAFRRMRFHGLAGLQYVLEYPRWILLRRLRLAETEEA